MGLRDKLSRVREKNRENIEEAGLDDSVMNSVKLYTVAGFMETVGGKLKLLSFVVMLVSFPVGFVELHHAVIMLITGSALLEAGFVYKEAYDPMDALEDSGMDLSVLQESVSDSSS